LYGRVSVHELRLSHY